MDQQNNVIEPLTDDSDDPSIPDGARDMMSDYEESETESAFGSLTSSINEHVWEYGRYYCSKRMLSSFIPHPNQLFSRRYHSFRCGRYPMPNDDAEFKRETLRHTMLKELLGGKLYLAPIGENPQKIMDLGTGFGDWAIEGKVLIPGRYSHLS